VRLAEAAAKVSNMISLGVRNDTSVARIQLTPASLGAIQIHLQRTADGVVARVVTEHPEAAQTLAEHSDDLRQSLERSGTTLLRLDIETSDQHRSTEQEHPTSQNRAGSPGDDSDAEAEGPAPTTTIELTSGGLSGAALVNVLA
jgi:flagellar hook-length control protein FliK